MAASSKPTPASDSDKTSDTKSSDTGSNRVAFADGPEHGYIGEVHPDKNNDDYTVAGVTKTGTGNVADQPSKTSVDARTAWAPLQKS